ncbi:GNAT family N-acetyltransferase [Desulfobulbus alkaliphilus]|uniref:GNAT family N-acetyltransferase n=1 Tax=Desulfobulbus alkaliphilus TaxID=869814 RepID=UPI0019645AC7|nr:GNAT family N-acetyltransferase [Desulfobulbus alkaliphilus]MBM9537555.1 GNAT family N-acetyltransferase [Desulfobulbus alkaliphilus]
MTRDCPKSKHSTASVPVSVVVRKGLATDFIDIENFVADAISKTYYRDDLQSDELQSHDDLVKSAPESLTKALAADDQKVFVAEVSGDLAGFLVLINLRAEAPELDWFIVARKFHGKGIAQAMMDVALASLSRYKQVRLGVIYYNTRAQNFYKKYGFSDTGQIMGSYLIPRILMVRVNSTAT